MRSRGTQIFSWIVFLIYCGLIVLFSSLPHIPATPTHTDKVIHFFEYAFFATLLWNATGAGGQDRKPRQSLRTRAMTVILVGAIYAALDELYQSMVPGRLPSLGDWVADVAGICGFITFSVTRFRMERAPAYETP